MLLTVIVSFDAEMTHKYKHGHSIVSVAILSISDKKMAAYQYLSNVLFLPTEVQQDFCH